MVHSGTYITRTDFAQLAVVSAGGDEWHDYTNKEHAIHTKCPEGLSREPKHFGVNSRFRILV